MSNLAYGLLAEKLEKQGIQVEIRSNPISKRNTSRPHRGVTVIPVPDSEFLGSPARREMQRNVSKTQLPFTVLLVLPRPSHSTSRGIKPTIGGH